MKRATLWIALVLFLATLACGSGTPTAVIVPTPKDSVFNDGRTIYGFFPSPPEITYESMVANMQAIGQHADVILVQEPIPWADFSAGTDGQSQKITDIKNLLILAYQNGLEAIFVVDPLNGLNRTEFMGLPSGWEASFDNPQVRAAFKNYTLHLVREFHPVYLGLASEINTYADAHPEDFPNYLSLYAEVYDAVKAESPETQLFVTFQWEDLNNLGPFDDGSKAYQTKWELVEAFEPRLDLWVISSYPFVAFQSGADVPPDYYTPLLTRTSKPLAVAESGFTSKDVGSLHGAPQDQVDYITAIHDQIGARLDFWIYLLLTDFNLESYAKAMRQQGQGKDVNTLALFGAVGLRQFDGTPKPALEVWDSFRKESDQ